MLAASAPSSMDVSLHGPCRLMPQQLSVLLGVWGHADAPGVWLQAVQLCEQVWQDLQGYGILPGLVLPACTAEG